MPTEEAGNCSLMMSREGMEKHKGLEKESSKMTDVRRLTKRCHMVSFIELGDQQIQAPS